MSTAPRSSAGETGRDFSFTNEDFSRIRTLIHRRAGISLNDQKQEMVYGRLARRLRTLGLTSFKVYLDQLEQNSQSDEWESFINSLTTNLTSFFRESHHFPLLAEFVKTRQKPVTVWCSASSTGEEPYSIAMTLVEALGDRPQAKVCASDIDTQVLAKARSGIYPLDQVDRLGDVRRKRFFLKGTGSHAGQARVKPEIRSMIDFFQVNLLDTTWPIKDKFDVIFCRNVMIYFDKPTQTKILERFVPLLKPGGLLFAGHSENFTYITKAFSLRGQTVYEVA
jgi:chemotaxis protein methyltransferase CheR